MSKLQLAEVAVTPAFPPVNAHAFYVRAGKFYRCDHHGVETEVGAGGAGGALPRYYFKINFDASQNPESVADLPSGWSASLSGNEVTITHTEGPPTFVSYWGYVDSGSQYRIRGPNSVNPASIPSVGANNMGNTFVLAVTTAVVGCDAPGHAFVSVIF